jgi:hypothetical protein
MKNKLYYKELLPLFILQTVFYVILFFIFWFGYNPKVCNQNIAYLSVFGWVISTGYLTSILTFKK